MQLRRKFLVGIVILGLVIGGVMFLTFDSQRSAAHDDAQAEVDQKASVISESIGRQVMKHQQLLRMAADDPRTARHGSADQRAVLETVHELDGVQGVSVVDGNGQMADIITADGETPESVVGEEYDDREYVAGALDGEMVISQPFRAETGNQIVVLSVPVYENGEIAGTLNAALYLDGLFFEAAVAPHAEDDTSVTITNGSETLYGDDPVHESEITATATVQRTGWEVSVDQEESAVTAQIRQLAIAQALTSLALLTAVGGFGIWVYRNHIRQTERLRDRLRSLERRRYDGELVLKGSTEWVEIGDAVDRLAGTLARREQMLLVLNRLLRHNLRNTLNVVIGRASQLSAGDRETAVVGGGDEVDPTEEIKAACRELLSLSDRARMTEQLLIREAQKRREVIDIVAVIHDRVEAFRERYPSATVTIDAPESVPIVADPECSTAIEELLENAGEHAGAAPTVEITVRTLDDHVEIVVQDDGPGIPADEQAVLTGERQISHLHHTGGLGLWLVGWTVTQCGGTIEIDCDSGTTVILTIPIGDLDDPGERY